VFLSAVIAIILGVTEPGHAWQAVGTAPMFVWELSIGLWMTFKGFKPSPITTTAPTRGPST
jgi:hypothetical protein